MGGGLDRPVGGQPGVGAGVEVDARMAGDDPTVAHDPVLDVEPFGAARARHLHLLGAGVGAAHRALGEHRAEQRERLVDAVDLAAEAAADGAAHEVQPVRGHLQDLRGGLQAEEQRLRVRVADVAARGVGGRDAPAGLGRSVLDRRHLVAFLDDVVGLAKGALDVAEPDLPEVVAVVVVPVAAVVLVDERSARRERLLDVEHRGQGLVVDPHPGRGSSRGGLGLGDDRGDRLAAVADLVERERRLVVGAEVEEDQQGVDPLRHVLGSEDAHHARHLRGLAHVHRANPGVVVGAAGELHVQHPRHGVVVEEAAAPGDVPKRVLALRGPADLVQIVVALVGEEILAEIHVSWRSLAWYPALCAARRPGAGAVRRGEDRLDDRLVAGAPADVAADGVDDIFAGGTRIGVQQRPGGHEHARGAESALGREVIHERLLQWMEAAGAGQRLGRLD